MDQFLLTADGAGQYAVLSSYFDSTVGQTFLQLNGNYHLSFKARGAGGANTIHAFVRRLAPSNSLLFDRIVFGAARRLVLREMAMLEIDLHRHLHRPVAVRLGDHAEGSRSVDCQTRIGPAFLVK